MGLACALAVASVAGWRRGVNGVGDPTRAPQGEVFTAPPVGRPVGEVFHLYKSAQELPVWCVPYGKEFWKRRQPDGSAVLAGKGSPNSGSKPVNLGEVVGRVSHSFAADPTGSPPEVKARAYTAQIDGRGIRLSLGLSGAFGTASTPSQPQRDKLEALASQTPESPEEEEALMTGLTSLAQQRATHAAAGPQADQPAGSPAEVRFETSAIRQGDHNLFSVSDASEWAVLGNTAQRLLVPAGGVVEHIEANGDGLDATWLVSKRPEGTGDLTLETRWKGLTYAGETSDGHHFADTSGTARVRVGRVTVVDAKGTTWPAPLQVHDQSLVITVSEAVLSQAAYPLAIDPVISPEFGLDLPLLLASPGAQQNPAVAANGSTFLVVWEDQRLAGSNGPAIYGTRVTAGLDGGGVVEDPSGIVVSPAGASAPSVAANGTGFLVVWSDGRNVGTNGLDIFGARVDASGRVIDSGGFPVCKAAGDQLSPAVSVVGADSFVVWQDARDAQAGPLIYGARVTKAGVVDDANGFPISPGVGIQASPSVAANGKVILVVWAGLTDGGGFGIQGARVGVDGKILDTSSLPICSSAGGCFFPKAAAIGTNFLVVWEDHREEGVGFVDIYGEIVPDEGDVTKLNNFPICSGLADCFAPTVAASLKDYLVLWQDTRNLGETGQDIYGARVGADGAIVDSGGFAVSAAPGDQSAPALAFNGVTYQAAWSDARNLAQTDYDIYGTVLSTEGAVAVPDGLIITSGPAEEMHPAAAFNGDHYLVVWEDDRGAASTGVDIFGVRVGATGSVLDASAIPISTAPGDQTQPTVAASGSSFLVVWQDGRNAETSGSDIFASRVTGSGVVLDPLGIPVSGTPAGDQMAPSVAGDGTNYFVVWQDGRNLVNEGIDIYGARVAVGGTVLDPLGVPLSQAMGAQYAPVLAFNGKYYLVAWSDERNLAGTGIDIFGARFDPVGQLLDPVGIPISQAQGDAIFPAVASAAGGFLVTWEDGRNAVTTFDDIYGARVSGDGVVLDPDGLAISVATGVQANPAVAPLWGGYLVVWEDGRNAESTGLDIYGVQVGTDGTVGTPAGFIVNAGGSDQQAPKLAAGGGGLGLVVFQSVDGGAERIVGNFVELNVSAPVLTIQTKTDELAVAWPVTATGYVLQSATDLTTPIHWQAVPTNQVVLSGTQYEALVQPKDDRKFFRLVAP